MIDNANNIIKMKIKISFILDKNRLQTSYHKRCPIKIEDKLSDDSKKVNSVGRAVYITLQLLANMSELQWYRDQGQEIGSVCVSVCHSSHDCSV